MSSVDLLWLGTFIGVPLTVLVSIAAIFWKFPEMRHEFLDELFGKQP